IYDAEHRIVSVATPVRTAASGAIGFECTPLPGAIDELLPPSSNDSTETALEPALSRPSNDGELAVFTAPTAVAFAVARARSARRGLAWAAIGSVAVIISAVGVFVLRSPRQMERPDQI